MGSCGTALPEERGLDAPSKSLCPVHMALGAARLKEGSCFAPEQGQSCLLTAMSMIETQHCFSWDTHKEIPGQHSGKAGLTKFTVPLES
mmetsp:Transcript_40775/g.96966  ORF Transcript_40775/g.96966 Transcript_40775/m.96966 type:complete len:89 (-) Transcript_40775:775-1041(-)